MIVYGSGQELLRYVGQGRVVIVPSAICILGLESLGFRA